jgi:hypothetical protein
MPSIRTCIIFIALQGKDLDANSNYNNTIYLQCKLFFKTCVFLRALRGEESIMVKNKQKFFREKINHGKEYGSVGDA